MISSNTWHLLLADEVLRTLGTDMYRGLTADEAKKRKRRLRGEVWHVRRTSAWEAAAAALFDLPTLLLVIAAAAAAVFDKRFEAGAIAAVLLVGAAVRTVVSVRANRILEDMARSRIPVSSVIRDGRAHLLPAYEIVPGDIIFLEPGDTVPCDGRVITGDDSVVSERGITSNDRPVHKFATVIATEADSGEVPCEFRSNMLFAGSLMLSGSVRIAATACGDDTLISMKQGGVTIEADRDFPLVVRLKRQSRAASLFMLAAVMLLSGLAVLTGGGIALPDVFLSGMAMAVASMSEFISTIAAIIFAVTVRKAASARENRGCGRILFRDPSRIEDVAASDALVFCGSSFFKSGQAELLAYRLGNVCTGADEKGGDPGELLSLALSATTQSGQRTGLSDGGKKTPVSHKTRERANIVSLAAEACAKRTGRLPSAFPVGDHRDSSDRLAVGLEISLCEQGGAVWAVACGSARDVLVCCSGVETESGILPLEPSLTESVLREAAELEARGARVLAVARRISPYPHLNRLAVLTQAMNFVGYFALSMEPEKNARENVDYLKRSGVLPILFTENPEADLFYGMRLGLFDENTVPIPAAQWDAPLAGRILSGHGSSGVLVAFDSIGDAYLGTAYAGAMTSLIAGRDASAKIGSAAGARRGEDRTPVSVQDYESPIKSIGNSTTTPRDLTTEEDVKIVTYVLSESVASRLREDNFKCRVVEISVRDNGLYSFTRQHKIRTPTDISEEIAKAAMQLFHENYTWKKPIRSIGVRASDLVDAAYPFQLSLFSNEERRIRQKKVDEMADYLRKRFGFYSLQRGLMYMDGQLSHVNAKEDHTVHPHGYFEKGNQVGDDLLRKSG